MLVGYLAVDQERCATRAGVVRSNWRRGRDVWLRLLGNPDPDFSRSRMDGMTAAREAELDETGWNE